MSSESFTTMLSDLQKVVKKHCDSCKRVQQEYEEIFYQAVTPEETIAGVQSQMILAKVTAHLLAGESVRLVLNYVVKRAEALVDNRGITVEQAKTTRAIVSMFKNSTNMLRETAVGVRQNAAMAGTKI